MDRNVDRAIPSPLPNIDRSTKPTEEEQLTHTVDSTPSDEPENSKDEEAAAPIFLFFFWLLIEVDCRCCCLNAYMFMLTTIPKRPAVTLEITKFTTASFGI